MGGYEDDERGQASRRRPQASCHVGPSAGGGCLAVCRQSFREASARTGRTRDPGARAVSQNLLLSVSGQVPPGGGATVSGVCLARPPCHPQEAPTEWWATPHLGTQTGDPSQVQTRSTRSQRRSPRGPRAGTGRTVSVSSLFSKMQVPRSPCEDVLAWGRSPRPAGFPFRWAFRKFVSLFTVSGPSLTLLAPNPLSSTDFSLHSLTKIAPGVFSQTSARHLMCFNVYLIFIFKMKEL